MRVAAVAMALAVLAGCGGNQAATEQEAAPSTTAASGTNAKDVTTGGEVVVGVEANPASIDYVGGNGGPADSATAYVQSMLYEGLTMQGPDGTATGVLAESFDHNEDFTEWTAKVRDGVTFTDGTPLDAAAVVDSFHYRMDPATCRCASQYEGVKVEATDPMTVKFTLATPHARFAETRMSDPIAAPPRSRRESTATRPPSAPARSASWTGRRCSSSATPTTGARTARVAPCRT